jgi:DinB superfamily
MEAKEALYHLRFPIGEWQSPEEFDASIAAQNMAIIENFPARIKAATERMSEAQLNTPYREGGWMVRQVVHHCADSHMNCLIRVKLLLTEDKPTIKPYQENLWAELADGKDLPIAVSIRLIEAVHHKLTVVLKSVSVDQWERKYVHPQYGREFRLFQVLSLYAWHCEHHLGHIELVK